MDNLKSLEDLVARITHFISDVESDAFQQEGFVDLSMRQVYYLETIARLGHPNFGELALALKITRPSVTALVSRLAHHGLVEKAQDGEDRRSFHILLTQKGRDFITTHQTMHKRISHTLTNRLEEEEIEQLTRILSKVVMNKED